MLLLGYDIGTSSVKASLVDVVSGKCIATAFYPEREAEIITVRQGWAEQDPEQWWQSLKHATAQIMAKSGAKKEDVITVGDNINDADMIREFYSYAMENGVDAIKQLADKTTVSVTELIKNEL